MQQTDPSAFQVKRFLRYLREYKLPFFVAVIGMVTSVSILAAPNGFGGSDSAVPLGLLIGIVSIIFFFILKAAFGVA